MASVLRRYVLFQIPGLILVSILLGSAHSWLGLSIPAAVGLFLSFVAKDFVLYPSRVTRIAVRCINNLLSKKSLPGETQTGVYLQSLEG